MRIVCLPDGLPIDYTIQLANSLSKREEVMVVLLDNSQIEQELIENINKDVNLYITQKVKYPLYHPNNLLLPFNIIREIRHFNPDIIHIQAGGDLLSFLILIFLSLKKYLLVTTFHDVQIHLGTKRLLLLRFIRFWLMKNSEKIFVHGRKLKEILVKGYNLPEHKVHAMPIGEHNVAPFKRYKKENVKEDNSILFFGWIAIHKGLEYLIKAEPIISKEVLNAKIIIAGRTGTRVNMKYLKKCQNMIEAAQQSKIGRKRKENISLNPKRSKIFNAKSNCGTASIINKSNFEIYPQYISWECGAELFQRASLVVLPYIETSQSGVIPVAYDFKKPVIVTDVGAMPEIVDDGVTGFIVPPKNPEALAEAIIKLLKDNKLRKQMGENAYKKLKTDLSWDKIAEKTIEIYKEAINEYKNKNGMIT